MGEDTYVGALRASCAVSNEFVSVSVFRLNFLNIRKGDEGDERGIEGNERETKGTNHVSLDGDTGDERPICSFEWPICSF